MCSIFAVHASAQTDAEIVKTKRNLLKVNTTYSKPSKDYVMLQAGFHDWILGDSAKDINLKRRGHDLNAYICLDFPLQKQHLSFSPGIGIGSSHVYLDSMIMPLTRAGSTYNTVQFLTDTSNTRYKVSLVYLEAPLEFRYYANPTNRNRGFKASVGAKVGTLVKAGNKAVIANGVKSKESARRYNEKWRITATARVGYGNFSLYANYQITEVFKAGNVQGIRPYTIGFCLSGL
jgi:hypothetical protein